MYNGFLWRMVCIEKWGFLGMFKISICGVRLAFWRFKTWTIVMENLTSKHNCVFSSLNKQETKSRKQERQCYLTGP